MAQRGRRFFCQADLPAVATRRLSFAPRSAVRDQPLPRRTQPRPKTLCLDRRPRPHHRRRKPRVPSVRFEPLGTVIALSAYAGFGSAVYFGEETINARRRVVRAIFCSLIIAIVGEALSVTAVLLGTADLPKLFKSQNALADFIDADGGKNLESFIALGIAVALINADLVIALLGGRLLWSTGRDHMWFTPINCTLSRTHRRFHSPWVATSVTCAIAIAACSLSLRWLIIFTSASLATTYATLCVAVIAARWYGITGIVNRYRMPAFPLIPLAGLTLLIFVLFSYWQDAETGRLGIFATAIIIFVAAAYYGFILRYRQPLRLSEPIE